MILIFDISTFYAQLICIIRKKIQLHPGDNSFWHKMDISSFLPIEFFNVEYLHLVTLCDLISKHRSKIITLLHVRLFFFIICRLNLMVVNFSLISVHVKDLTYLHKLNAPDCVIFNVTVRLMLCHVLCVCFWFLCLFDNHIFFLVRRPIHHFQKHWRYI